MDSISSEHSVVTPPAGTAAAHERWGAGDRKRDTPVTARLELQARAPANLRRHVLRAARRVTVLLVADLASFWVMRELTRAVRDVAVLGTGLGDAARAIAPQGLLVGWQYAFALLVGLVATGNYGRGNERRSPERILAGCALATALALWDTIWIAGFATVAVEYAVITALVWAGILAERRLLDRVVALVAPPERSAPRTLLVGPSASCQHELAAPLFTKGIAFRTLGYIATDAGTNGALGHLSNLRHVLHRTRAETVVVCGNLAEDAFQDIVDAALGAGCHLLSVPRSTQMAGVQPALVWHQSRPLMELTAPSLKAWQLALKRMVDLLGATVLLVVASPLMLAIAAAIKLDSSGPVLFGQERIGTGGRRFRVLKFRTMRHGVSDAAHRALVQRMIAGDEQSTAHDAPDGRSVYKLVKDDRVTAFGRLLRRSSLDELPQLFNVLRGEMSLVGPRPPLAYEIELYDHWQYDRLQVRPGITGLWQVSGRNLLTYRQMCELDVTYVRTWSLWLDLKILAKTIPVVLFNAGRAA